MSKSILVTGSCGFIGYHLCLSLLKKGFTVIGVDNFNNYYDPKLKEIRSSLLGVYKEFTLYRVDICDYSSLEKIMDIHKIDTICHLAAQAGVRYSLECPEVYLNSNNNGFLNILELARHRQIPRVIFASSSSVYGNSNLEKLSEKDNTDHPISIYAATKKFNEVLAYSYSQLFKIETIGLRFFTVYGPWGRPDMALFKFTKNILNNKPITVYNKGNMYRDFTHVEDIISGIEKTISYKIKDTLIPNIIFNLGCGNPRKLSDFIHELEKICNKKAMVEYLPLQKGDVLKTYADITLAKEELNYDPQIQIENGLFDFVSWFKYHYKI